MVAFDGRASTRRQVIEIEDCGAKLKFVVQGVGAYEANEMREKYGTINAMTGEFQIEKGKLADANFEILRKILVEAPFELTDENIKDIDLKIVGTILDAVGFGPAAVQARKNSSRQ